MIVVLKPGRDAQEEREVSRLLRDAAGVRVTATTWKPTGEELLVCDRGVAADLVDQLTAMSAVERVVPSTGTMRLAGRSFSATDRIVDVAGVAIGGQGFVVAAGPCAVESAEQLEDAATAVTLSAARLLRGGAYKPRTSPYSFQGLGVRGLEMLAAQRKRTGLPVVTEVMSPADVELVAGFADMLQIGTRNMQNFPLLHEVGASGKPVLLKRGMAATIEEWLLAAEHILRHGDGNVVLCERGIRTFEPLTRFTLDLSAVPAVKRLSHLPVIVDPSHGTGHQYLVKPLALAAAAVGADGLLIDVHATPSAALCDGQQALSGAQFDELMGALTPVLAAVGRPLAAAPEATRCR
jgi:3-deoxy-7-phosphoheptulonate synthase